MELSMSSSYDFESMDIIDRLDFLRPDTNIFFFYKLETVLAKEESKYDVLENRTKSADLVQ